MMDKKVPIIVGVVIVVAFLVLAFGLIGPGIKFGGEKNFSELFDSMNEKFPAEYLWGHQVIVLDKALYPAGTEIAISDKIIAISAESHSTSFTFLYSGTEWRNETSGNSFFVQVEDDNLIDVSNSVFHIHISGDLHGLYDVGDTISLKTTAVAEGNDNVLGHTWVIVA